MTFLPAGTRVQVTTPTGMVYRKLDSVNAYSESQKSSFAILRSDRPFQIRILDSEFKWRRAAQVGKEYILPIRARYSWFAVYSREDASFILNNKIVELKLETKYQYIGNSFYWGVQEKIQEFVK